MLINFYKEITRDKLKIWLLQHGFKFMNISWQHVVNSTWKYYDRKTVRMKERLGIYYAKIIDNYKCKKKLWYGEKLENMFCVWQRKQKNGTCPISCWYLTLGFALWLWTVVEKIRTWLHKWWGWWCYASTFSELRDKICAYNQLILFATRKLY